MIIEYKVINKASTTNCPLGRKVGNLPIKVGGSGCAECVKNKGRDTMKKIVSCEGR
jgi:hypothetical protein